MLETKLARVESEYLCKKHQKSKDNTPPYPLPCPKLHKGDSEPDTRKEERLHKILLHIQQVPLESVYKCRTLILLSFAFLSAHDYKRSIWVLTGNISQECTSQERTKEDGSPRIRGNADKCAEDQDHQDDVGDVVESSEVILDIAAEERRKEEFCYQRGYNSHADGGYNRAAN